jgi:hypothetical protein|uniref:Uncharacterized protein n=1 Tax=viral metagenome TaxID=1070528 RepID=A0A6C0EGG2_9ZZZZ
MDVNKLIDALDNENNEKILNLTTKKIKEMNMKILMELSLSREKLLDITKKLNGYRYVDEIDELKCGTYLKWILLTDPDPDNLELNKGALFCEIKCKDDGVFIICKNMGFSSRHFQIKMDECLLFQKLTTQELVLLSALDHLST